VHQHGADGSAKKNDIGVLGNTDIPHTAPGGPGESDSEYAEQISLSQRTEAVVRGLILVLTHHSVEGQIMDELSKQVHHYLDSSINELVWLKRCKYLLSYPLAKYLRNDLPKEPDQLPVFEKCLKGFMKSRLNAFNRKNTHLWYSWFQSKRAALTVSKVFIEDQYADHFKKLTSPDPGCPDLIERVFQDKTFLMVLDRIRESIRPEAIRSLNSYNPSINSSFMRTRKQGGQKMELISQFLNRERTSYLCFLDVDELSSMEFHQQCFSDGILYHYVTIEVRAPYGFEDWNSIRAPVINRRLKCKVQAICEPLKVRVITKGESLPYYSCKWLQKELHTALRSMSCFRLLDRPISPTDLMDLKTKASKDWEWFSIDYSAATDGLSWRYSSRIFSYILQDLPDAQRDLAFKVLGPHQLSYPVEGRWVIKGSQQNGQLMGSILSFPLLCLANLGVYLYVTQETQRDWYSEERLNHVLINGDDMLYASRPEDWDFHTEIGRRLGLEMSVGKAYRHHTFCNVNSVSFHYSLRDSGTPWQIDFLNSGLFFGQSKVHDDEEKNEVTIINRLLEGCLPGRSSSLLSMYLHRNKEGINRITSVPFEGGLINRNLFLPISVGGMGVEKPPGFRCHVTRDQMKLALSISATVPFGTIGSPIFGYPVEESTQPIFPWQSDRMIDSNYEDEDGEIVEVSGKEVYDSNYAEANLPFLPLRCPKGILGKCRKKVSVMGFLDGENKDFCFRGFARRTLRLLLNLGIRSCFPRRNLVVLKDSVAKHFFASAFSDVTRSDLGKSLNYHWVVQLKDQNGAGISLLDQLIEKNPGPLSWSQLRILYPDIIPTNIFNSWILIHDPLSISDYVAVCMYILSFHSLEEAQTIVGSVETELNNSVLSSVSKPSAPSP